MLHGWDFNTLGSSATNASVNHYYFELPGGPGIADFTGTSTLVWNRQLNQTGINDLDLFLYDAVSGNLIAASTSRVDNVEHIFAGQLPPGRYDLQVLKNGGLVISSNETYALAFDFSAVSLGLVAADAALVLTWPVYPDRFVLEATPTPALPASWSDVPTAPVVANDQNLVILNLTNNAQFFRLMRP